MLHDHNINIKNLRCPFFLQVQSNEQAKYEEFWKLNDYVAGSYDGRAGFEALNEKMSCLENDKHANRIFYLALPPSVFDEVTINIKEICMSKK